MNGINGAERPICEDSEGNVTETEEVAAQVEADRTESLGERSSQFES